MPSNAPQPQIADADIRERVLDTRESFIVQAPAGSGKTELLMQRFLALLARVGEPEAVLAITFTRKAASEMRSRIMAALDAASGPAPANMKEHERHTRELALRVLAHDRQRGWHLRENPSRLQVRTVDSFCDRIARALPLLSGLGTHLEVVDDPTSLYDQAAQCTLLMLGEADETSAAHIAQLLRYLDNNFGSAAKLIVAMLGMREQWLRIVGPELRATEERMRELRTELEAALASALRYELQRLRNSVEDCLSAADLRELLAHGRFAAEKLIPEHPFAPLCRLSALPGCEPSDVKLWSAIHAFCFTTAGTLRKQFDARTGFAPEHRDAKQRCMEFFAGLAASEHADRLCAAFARFSKLPPAAYTDEQWAFIRALYSVLPLAVAQLKTVFTEQGAVDFSEISQAAIHALDAGEHPEIAMWLGEDIQHVLVDEFQDTSLAQVELLARLLENWERDGAHTLFAVGDPMQSIYAFRQAEVVLFTRAQKQGIHHWPLTSVPLRVNFRSQQQLVGWFNQTFRDIFTGENDVTAAVDYVECQAMKCDDANAGVEVHPFTVKDDAAEAELVADLTSTALAETADGTVAILVRARTHLPAVVDALKSRGIRFRATGIDPLSSRQAVIDVHALTEALHHLAYRAAWLAVLRAPWCGLQLADLWTLCRDSSATPVLDLLRERAASLSADGRTRVERIAPVLARAAELFGRIPLRSLVESTWISLGGPASLASEADARDVAAYFDLLAANEVANHIPDRALFSQKLEKLYAAPDTAEGIRVDLMTIHGAKGLEFDTVILPGLGRKTGRDEKRLLYWRELLLDGAPRLLLAPVHAPGSSEEQKGITTYLKLLESDRNYEETKRLLYVAATRARRKLHLIGHKDGRAETGSLLRVLLAAKTVSSQFPPDGDKAPKPEPTQSERTPLQLRRLSRDWQLPSPPPALVLPRDAQSAPALDPHTFDWASENLRRVGTVTHAFLDRIGREGLDRVGREEMPRWDAAAIAELEPAIRTALLATGISPDDLPATFAKVSAALTNAVTDERGRWILATRPEAQCEYELSGELDGGVVRVRIDRTFIENGERWIVDYKISDNAGAGFLDAQVEKYRDGLLRYSQLIARADARPIRIGLYFPLLRGWREVS